MKALELLDDIQKLQFYAVELNLYLDNFPENRLYRPYKEKKEC